MRLDLHRAVDAPAVLTTAAPTTAAPTTAAPTTAEYHDPAWLVRRAWSSHRLPGLQALIRTTIGALQELSPSDVLPTTELPAAQRSARLPDPLTEALRACSEELQDASGMAGAQVSRAAHCSLVRGYISQQPAVWGTTFAAALDKYRRAACAALLTAFQQDAAVR